MFAFLFSNSQQHAAVRSGVLGKRLICLVRGVLLGIALAERLVDTGDARRFRPAGAGLFAGLEKIDRAELWQASCRAISRSIACALPFMRQARCA